MVAAQPAFTAATILPDPAFATNTLRVQCKGWYDADGDPEGYHYQWKTNGTAIAGATNETLTGACFRKGDAVACLVTAWDGVIEGTAIETEARVISNSAPTFAGTVIFPPAAYPTSTLSVRCAGWNDADGDPDGYRYQWKTNGAPVASATNAVLAALPFQPGDSVTCRVTAWDGTIEGTALETAPRLIVKPPPPFKGIAIR